MDKKSLIDGILEGCRTVRRLRPLVHMIPNYVTAGICADAIAAVGGRPLMASAPEEMAEITASADGLAVNMGQPSEEKYRASAAAMKTAAGLGIPVLFDPVGAGASQYRRNMAGHLTELPWSGVIKGNSSEIRTVLTGMISHEGVDSLEEFDNRSVSACFFRQMQEKNRSMVLVSTGVSDRILWQEKDTGNILEIILNHPAERPVVMVGTGCIAGALGGTLFAAAGMELKYPDQNADVNLKSSVGKESMFLLDTARMAVLSAAAVALTAFAGDEAGSGLSVGAVDGGDRRGWGAASYGTYQMRFLDCLSNLDEERFAGYLEWNLEFKEE